jgi:hypothetical protein
MRALLSYINYRERCKMMIFGVSEFSYVIVFIGS